jgi:hypothetical protein
VIGTVADAGEEVPQRGHAFRGVMLVAGIAAVGGLLFEYDTGVISAAILYLRAEFRLSPGAEGVVDVLTLGALAGAIATGWVSVTEGETPEEIGRFWR